MEVYQEQVVKVFTTPDKLRSLADILQKKFDKSGLGDDLSITAWRGKGIRVDLVCDQQNMKRTGK